MAAQPRAQADVDAGDTPCAGFRDELDVARSHQPSRVDVDQTVAEEVGAQQHLAGAALELGEVERRRRGVGAARLEPRRSAQALATVKPRDHILNAAETLVCRIKQRAADQRGKVENAVRHRRDRNSVRVRGDRCRSYARPARCPIARQRSITTSMGRKLRVRLTAAAALIGALLVLAGCSSPLTLVPAANEKAQYQPDVHAAQAMAQELKAEQDAEAGATTP